MDAKTEAICGTLATQRNQALDAVAHLNGEVAELKAKIAELEARLTPAEGQAQQ